MLLPTNVVSCRSLNGADDREACNTHPAPYNATVATLLAAASAAPTECADRNGGLLAKDQPNDAMSTYLLRTDAVLAHTEP